MRQARNNGADRAVLKVIEAMPDADYEPRNGSCKPINCITR